MIKVTFPDGGIREYAEGCLLYTSAVRAAGIPVYGTFLDGEPIYDAALSPGGVIVMGSEGQGVSPEVAELVSRRLFIPPFRCV